MVLTDIGGDPDDQQSLVRLIDADVVTQVKQYAMAVAKDERFNGVKATWTFIAVSNELDDFARHDANQRGRQKGLVFDHPELRIAVLVKEWAEIINDAKSKLKFFSQQLAYEADRESAKTYLKKAHSKYIPDLDEPDLESTEPE
jgi:hypothetical protein